MFVDLGKRIEEAEPARHKEKTEEIEKIGKKDSDTKTQLSSEPAKQIPQVPQIELGTQETSAVVRTNPQQSYEDIKFEVKRNSRVEHYIRRFSSGKGKKNFAEILKRSGIFLPEIREILRSEEVPLEIAYLPLIESGFNPRAVSRKNAVGLWQFIRPTGLKYGLKINYWVDERMDVDKSTSGGGQISQEDV